MKHVIIGNGPAGVVAAETLRKLRPADEIHLIGDEKSPPYSRMAIPYLLIGQIPESGTHLRKSADHFERLRIHQVAGRVTALDAQARRVALSDGTSLPFDRCLIAAGSQPVQPPIPGLDSPFVHPCWTLHDARNISQLARPGARVLQMGAGFIGCIILEALARRGVKLTVVEMGDRMVPRMMGPGAGTLIKSWVQSKGVIVYTSTRVEALEPGDPLSVRFSDGRVETYDLVIQATGVKPAIGFLSNSAVKCLQGVLVDETLQTSVPGVYAAGDCAEAFDPVVGKTIVSAIQPNAVEQAYVAAMNMAGHRNVSRGVTQINVLDTLGLISTSFGRWEGVPGGDHVEHNDPARYRYLRLSFKDDVLVGANTLGMTDHVGVLRNLIEREIRLGPWKDELMKDPTRLMEAYLASAQAQGDWQGAARGSSR